MIPGAFRFGRFEVDRSTYVVTRDGRLKPLYRQPGFGSIIQTLFERAK